MQYDALIIGAGVIGLSIAYHLKKACPENNVLIVEAKEDAGLGDSGKSAAAFRTCFYSRTNIALATTSVEFYKYVQEKLGYNLNMRYIGYLFLLTKRKYEDIRNVLNYISKRGLRFEIIDTDVLKKRLGVRTSISYERDSKLMGLEDIHLGILVKEAGIMDPMKLVKFYEEQFVKLGGKILYNTKVHRLIVEPRRPLGLPNEPYPWQDVRIAGVETSRGVFKAKKTIVATGAQAPQLLDPIGIDAHIKPKKRQIFVIEASTPPLRKLLRARNFNKENILPLTILPKGVYIRPAIEENSFWIGMSDYIGRAFMWEEEPKPELRFYFNGIYMILFKYFPQFSGAKPARAWAGFYDISLDYQPVVFEVEDLIVAAGTSGSGIMKADAIGRIVKSLYLGEKYAELYGGEKFKVKDLSLDERRVEKEKLII